MLTAHATAEPISAGFPSGSEAVDPELRILIVDDHPAVRMGLRQLLDDTHDLMVVEAVCSAETAMSVAEREPIDVAVVDYQLGSRSGLWLSRRLKRLPQPPRVLIYSAYCDGPLSVACVVAEADGLVSKGEIGTNLCDAVRAVARGRSRLPLVPAALAGAIRRRLGPEEQAVFGMLMAGIEPAEIAATLGISKAGLDSRMWAMLHKLESLRPDHVGESLRPSRAARRRPPGC
jgi:DNA-binding NarL/FixJ family response regulator